jgi:hypothetical protein
MLSVPFASKLSLILEKLAKNFVINHKLVVFCLQIREIPKQTLETQL